MNSLNVDYFKSIEDVTKLSVDDFYRVFKEKNDSFCVETPMSNWK